MRPSEALKLHRNDVFRIVEANKGMNPRVFGSVARGEDTEDSDLDLLIEKNGRMTLFDLGGIIYELEKTLGVKVDVATPGSLPDKLKARIEKDLRPI